MASADRNNKRWTQGEVRELEGLAQGNTPTRVIALKLRRTEHAVSQKASREGVSQSPYNRRK